MVTNVDSLESAINRDYASMSIDEQEEGGLIVIGDEGDDGGNGKLDL